MSAPWWDSDWKDRSGPEYRCFVGNLPYGTSESSLKDAFSSYAPLYSEVSWSDLVSMVAPLVCPRSIRSSRAIPNAPDLSCAFIRCVFPYPQH